mgnify:FL=1|jgi:1-acyl-sn-glycerol-3-phosphate acyltransferase|tara:strand:- start:2043 stop:2813 length:771 start_codon:yes stop_codon:yes gene_type:complete
MMVKKMNYSWRLFATTSAYMLFGVGGTLLPMLALSFFLLPGSQYIRQKRTRLLVHWTFKGYIHFLRLSGVMHWKVQGKERLKKPGILVIANHPTLLDVVFLIAFMPNADCIVKSSLMMNPAMRGFVTLTGYIKNDSGKLLVEDAKKSLNNGSSLIIFAEGTRTKPDENLSFKRGAANIVIRTKNAPTPVIINCFPKTLRKSDKWYNIPDQKVNLLIRVLEEIKVNKFTSVLPSVGARQLTKYLEEFFQKEISINEH